MDFSDVVRGLPVEFQEEDDPSSVSTNTKNNILSLVNYSRELGLASKHVKMVVNQLGQVRVIAEKFIQCDSQVILIPTSLDLSCAALKEEMFSSSRTGFNELTNQIQSFEASFKWNDKNYMRKDCFSHILVFVACIYCAHHKHNKLDTLGEELPPILKTLEYYWRSLPCKTNSLLFDWTDEELEYLKPTAVYKALPDSRRFGIEIFEKVFRPFVMKYPDYFGERATHFDDFASVCAVVSSRSYGCEEHDEKMLPIIDMIAVKPLSSNCVLDGISVHGHYIRAIKTSSAICAGDELFMEYSSTSNGDYLISKHHLPLDINVLMHNPKTEICLNMTKYFDVMLKRIHPSSPQIRDAKKTYIYSITGVPRTLVVSEEAMKKHGIQCLRQVLIFLQSDEAAMRKTIQTQRLKYRVNAFLLFQSFFLLIENQMGRPDCLELFQSLAAHPEKYTENMKSAIYLHMSERVVVEQFINEFVELFDDLQFPTALSLLGGHMLADDVHLVLVELLRSATLARSKMCMMCGECDHIVRCSRCHVAFYCGSACQQSHWRAGHKRDCRKPDPPLPPIDES